jgi:hypothetical protein
MLSGLVQCKNKLPDPSDKCEPQMTLCCKCLMNILISMTKECTISYGLFPLYNDYLTVTKPTIY